jgi:hypothetical protein
MSISIHSRVDTNELTANTLAGKLLASQAGKLLMSTLIDDYQHPLYVDANSPI